MVVNTGFFSRSLLQRVVGLLNSKGFIAWLRQASSKAIFVKECSDQLSSMITSFEVIASLLHSSVPLAVLTSFKVAAVLAAMQTVSE